MSATSFCRVLALLDSDPEDCRDVLERAIELAEAERSRLTLARTTSPGRVVACMCSFSALACAPTVSDGELRAEAGRQLARAAALVPGSIPLTTVLLGHDSARALRQLVQSGCHDLIVLRRDVIAHSRCLRRAIRRLGVSTLIVEPAAASAPRAELPDTFRPRPATQT